jgi:hypothetical protein
MTDAYHEGNFLPNGVRTHITQSMCKYKKNKKNEKDVYKKDQHQGRGRQQR